MTKYEASLLDNRVIELNLDFRNSKNEVVIIPLADE